MKEEFTHTWAITAHKESPYLEECICSIKQQTTKSEIIMCTATDNELIRSLATKYNIPLFVKDGKDDVRENWDFAYSLASGNWVTLAHQDDIYNSKYVEVLKTSVEKVKNASIFFTDYEPMGGNAKGSIRNRNIQRVIKIPLKSKYLACNRIVKCMTLSIGNSICCPTVSFNKSLLGQNIFTRYSHKNIHANLDWELWIALAKQKNTFVYSSQQLLIYRIHELQATAAYMENNHRFTEDYNCFRLIWARPIAKLLAKMYSKAYKIY